MNAPAGPTSPILDLTLSQLDDNPFQPRRSMDQTQLDELAASIRTHGLLQAITVRPIAGGRYQVAAGHRRLAAFKQLQAQAASEEEGARYATIPGQLRHYDDAQMALIAYTENVVRANLTLLEEALALATIRSQGRYATVKEIAAASTQPEARVKRLLRLAEAPAVVREAVSTGCQVLVAGKGGVERREQRRLDLVAALLMAKLHAYYLLRRPKEADARTRAAVERALEAGWSSRRVEAYVAGVIGGRPEAPPAAPVADEVASASQAAEVTDEVPALPASPLLIRAHGKLTVDENQLELASEAELAELRRVLAGLVAQVDRRLWSLGEANA